MFNRMKVGTRLTFAFAAVIALLIAVLAVAIARMGAINDNLQLITQVNNEEIRFADGMVIESYAVALGVRSMMLATNDAEMKAADAKMRAALEGYESYAASLQKIFDSDPATTASEKELAASAASTWRQLRPKAE